MVLSEFAIPLLTSICMYGSVCFIISHCIKIRETNYEKNRKYVILTEETYNTISQPHSLEQKKMSLILAQPPPKYNEIDTI